MTTAADVLIQGGTVVTEGWVGEASVVVRDGRVAALLEGGDSPTAGSRRVVDARGMLVLPGGVDPHCHVGLPLGAYTTKDSFRSASLAALAGGTTTMVDFAIPRVGQHPLEALEERAELAAASRCDYAFHGCFNAPSGDIRDTVRELAGRGVRTVKLFTTYRDLLMVDTATIAEVMAALQEVSGLTYVHAEANDLVERSQRQAADEGRIGAGGHARTRPAAAEEAAVEEVLAVARRLSAPVYFVHQSTPTAVDLVWSARRDGGHAYSESCPHYLTLDDGRYATSHPERWVCCPPLRDRPTVDALALRMRMGFVDAVGSDHCCYDSEQKMARADDVREMPNGLPGVETRISVVFSEFVARGRLSLRQLAAVTAANPARLNGLYPRKGTIAPGSDADLVVLDPRQTRRVHAADLHMETDYSPYEGLEVTGWPVTVLQRGRVVVDGGELEDQGPVGEWLHAEALDPSIVGR
jgi:dihydropyrimidinase